MRDFALTQFWSRGWLALLLLGGVMFPEAMGATPKPAGRYDLRVWQTDEGLPQNTVTALAQTADGYLWVGTREGLARFDGVRFTVVEEPTAPYLKQSWITALTVGRDGSLWIASESNGVTRWQAGKFTHFLKADGLPDNQIQCLLEARDGTMWFGGETGLARYRHSRLETLTDQDGLNNNSVKGLCEDASGILRVATVTGLVSVDSAGKASRENFGLGSVAGVLKAVCRDRQGRLWLGATDGLVCLTDGKRGSYATNQPLSEKITTVIHEDRAGQLWVGTYGGLSRRVDGDLSPWWLNKTGISDLINTLYEDREQNLWVGGRDGLYRLSPARFVTLTLEDGLTDNNVVSVLEDRDGAMWFGTWGGGVTRLKDRQFTAITTTNGLTNDKVLSLHESRSGSVWVGMDGGGVLNRLGPTLTNELFRLSGLSNAPIRVIYEHGDNTLWVGTGKGLHLIRSNQVETFTTTNGLAGNDVTVIVADRQNTVWIGTDGGLSHWTGEGFTNLTTAGGLSHNYINALHVGADQEIWVGTKRGGLNRIRAGQITRYTTRQGLFSDEVYEILEDDSGFLWMSCRRGLFRVSRSQFDAFDQGKTQSINCTTFGREDGLATVQFNGVAKPAGWKSRDGRLWFVSIRGVVAVEPDVTINDQPPEVTIEEVMLDQQALRKSGPGPAGLATLTIPPGSGRMAIHYTALSLQAAEKNHFKYRLDGVDDRWLDAGHQRVASYPKLAPGLYRFQVIACNNDGVWNATGAAIALRVEPHFWQTWWFRAALAAVPFVMVVLIYRARVARLRELENLRVRIAADLHDDVGARLTKVAMVTELADRETPGGDPGKPHLQNISRTVREITRAMDEIVWTINPRNDSLENLANYIFHYAQEYFQDTTVRCRLDLPAVLPEQRISTEERHNLFMAVKEALNNVLKHADATEVRIALTVVEKRMMIVITDNGRGVNEGLSDLTGDGLLNMRRRLETIGGRFDLESKPGIGTTVTMQLPGRWFS